MFCPRCGSKNSTEQKFCRSCGMNLEQTAVELAGQFGSDHEISTRSIDRFFNSLGKFAFGGFATVLVIGLGFLLYTILSRFILNGSQIAFGVFLFLFVVFAALSLVYVIYNESKKDRKVERRVDPLVLERSAPDTGKLLTESSELPIPSVIDDTTDLLHIEARTRKL